MRDRTIYVAGASREIDMIERYMGELRRAGWTITEDWCANMRAVGVADSDLPLARQREHARSDLQAIRTATHLWLLVPETQSDGAWVELGYALCIADEHLDMRTLASGRSSLFTSLVDRRFGSHDDALDYLVSGARST